MLQKNRFDQNLSYNFKKCCPLCRVIQPQWIENLLKNVEERTQLQTLKDDAEDQVRKKSSLIVSSIHQNILVYISLFIYQYIGSANHSQYIHTIFNLFQVRILKSELSLSKTRQKVVLSFIFS